MVGLVVPVMKNFKGFAQLMESVDISITPYIVNNWDNNRGVAAGWNEGIRRGIDEDYLIIANDDVVFYPGAMDNLLDTLLPEKVDLLSVVATDTQQEGFWEADFPDFACYAIRPRNFVERFGYFDEHFTPAYFEDNDMAYRIKISGGRQGLCLDARVEHAGSATQYMEPQNPVVSSQQFEANRAYYISKWGGVRNEELYLNPFNNPSLLVKDWYNVGG